jgi:Fe-S-cluster-containing dehydrogenase component
MTAAFLLDLGRCIGCEACVAACKTGNELPPAAQYIELIEHTRGTFPDLTGGFENHRCYHCTDAACVDVCPTGALFKENGLTRLDRDACSGCGYCVESCPYAVPEMVEGRAAKCDGCAATTSAGGEPWCVQTCPSRALEYGERNEIMAEAYRRATSMSSRCSNAQVYGESQAGGLGVVVVLPGDDSGTAGSMLAPCRQPAAQALPADPQVPLVASFWQKVVQPASLGLTAATAVAAGVMAVIARRNHMQEIRALEAQAGGETTSDPEDRT